MRKTKMKVESPRLKAYLEAKKHDTVLLGAVDRHIQMLTDHRDATVIHPSEMCKPDWCPRATWHRLVGHEPRERAVPPLRLALIFEEGTASGKKWQRWTRDMGILWGRWLCRICSLEKYGWSDELGGDCSFLVTPMPHIWKYMEVPLGHGLIGGHADGIVNPSGNESLIMENKTVGPGTLRLLKVLGEEESDEVGSDRFSRITAILPSHFRQTQLYLRLAQDPDLEDQVGPISRAVVVYEYKADQQVREFVIEYDSRWTDHIWDTALEIEWAIDKGRQIQCPYSGCPSCHEYEVS